MPTLADIYSAIDSAKRRGSDFIQNPGLSLQQMVGLANDRAGELNQQTAAAAQEGVKYGPASQALGQTLAGAYNPIGMTAWHGSPHIFEKFDANKIGSGVGAQAYGKGLYLTESPNVAESYSKNTMGPKATPENIAIKVINSTGNESVAFSRLKQIYPNMNDAEIKLAIDKAKNYQGNLYKVDLPDTHVRRMIDWDAPLKEQPQNVRKLAKSLGMDMNDLGGDLVTKVGKDEAGRSIMQQADIRGIKYLNDQGDNLKQKSRNFVVFDPSHLTVLERNQQPIK